MIRGIDVSENNGHIPQSVWDNLYEEGIRFVYVRSSYGQTGVDEEFRHNVECAHKAGMKVGAYHYSYALDRYQALVEALHCKEVIADAGVLLELPVFYDMEDADYYKERNGFTFDPNEITDMCKTFGLNIGLNWGVYASYSWFENYIDWRSLGCPVWNAQWGAADDLGGYVWQYTDSYESQGRVFDANYMYVDEV